MQNRAAAGCRALREGGLLPFFDVLSIFPALLIAVGLLGILDVVVGPDVATGAKNQVGGA
jgi:uncharacterized BrkB/YihY/UPF0761 family membrane protein